MSPSAGTVLTSSYALTDRVSAGGMGEFWAATDTVPGRADAVAPTLTGVGVSCLVNTAAQTPTDQAFATAPHPWPIQGAGQSATASNDIHALGMVGDEMLTVQPPFIPDSLLATAVAPLNMTPPADLARSPGTADATDVSRARAVSPVAAVPRAGIGGARTPGAMPATTTEITSPSKDSHMPGQPTMSQAAAMDHHEKKDGKQ